MAPTKPVAEGSLPVLSILKAKSPTPITKHPKATAAQADKLHVSEPEPDNTTSKSTRTVPDRPRSQPLPLVLRELLASQLLAAMAESNGCAVAFLRSWMRAYNAQSVFAADRVPLLVGRGARFVVNEEYEISGDLGRVMERRIIDSERAKGEWDGCNTWGVQWGREGLARAKQDLKEVAMKIDTDDTGDAIVSVERRSPPSLHLADYEVSRVGSVADGPNGREVDVELAAADGISGAPIVSKVLLESEFNNALAAFAVGFGSAAAPTKGVSPKPLANAAASPPRHGPMPELLGLYISPDGTCAAMTWTDKVNGHMCKHVYDYPLDVQNRKPRGVKGNPTASPTLTHVYAGKLEKKYLFEWTVGGKATEIFQELSERELASAGQPTTPLHSHQDTKRFRGTTHGDNSPDANDDTSAESTSSDPIQVDVDGKKAVHGGIYNSPQGRQVKISWKPARRRLASKADDQVTVLLEGNLQEAIDAARASIEEALQAARKLGREDKKRELEAAKPESSARSPSS